MFAKLALLILVIGGSGGGVLAMRQSRLQAAHELTAARLRLGEHQQQLERVRATIARNTSPEAIEAMLARNAKLAQSLRPAIEQRGYLPAPGTVDREAGAVQDESLREPIEFEFEVEEIMVP